MNFFNMGPGELLFILALALLIFGPRRLPEVARDLGKAVRQFQQASQQLTGELAKEMEQATKALDEAQESVTASVSEVVTVAATELTEAGAAATTELKEAAGAVGEELQQAAAAAAETPRPVVPETLPGSVERTEAAALPPEPVPAEGGLAAPETAEASPPIDAEASSTAELPPEDSTYII